MNRLRVVYRYFHIPISQSLHRRYLGGVPPRHCMVSGGSNPQQTYLHTENIGSREPVALHYTLHYYTAWSSSLE